MTGILGTPLPPAKLIKEGHYCKKAKKVPKSTTERFVFAKLLLNPPFPLGLQKKTKYCRAEDKKKGSGALQHQVEQRNVWSPSNQMSQLIAVVALRYRQTSLFKVRKFD